MTELLYYSTPIITECGATVLSCEKDERSGAYKIILDRTMIYPEGGGQPADRGSIVFRPDNSAAEQTVRISDARTENGSVVHFCDAEIPAGTIDGQTLRLKGLGEPSYNGGTPGDVLITLNVDRHPYFILEDKNILLELPVTLKEAILGGKVTVPTITGKVAVNIPPYASSGEKLRLKGKGVKGGDQIITLKVIMPKTKSPELEKALLGMPDEGVRTF